MVESDQRPIGELTALLPVVHSWEGEYGETVYAADTEQSVNNALPKLRDACGNCPACILAALRQKGIPVPLATGFNFTQEMQSLWADINESNCGGEY